MAKTDAQRAHSFLKKTLNERANKGSDSRQFKGISNHLNNLENTPKTAVKTLRREIKEIEQKYKGKLTPNLHRDVLSVIDGLKLLSGSVEFNTDQIVSKLERLL